MPRIRLLSTDFDGTLISHPSDGRCVEAFAEILRDYQASGGIWAVNTGRSLAHAIEGIAIFGAPVTPDFLLTNEREIFQREPDGHWSPHHEWNQAYYDKHDDLFDRADHILESIHQMAERSPQVTIVEEDGRSVGLITSSEEAMNDVAAFLDEACRGVPDFSYQRNTIYLRFCHRDYHKGSSLAALSNHLAIERAQVMAAGDHFNDIPMLDGQFAAYCCCPSNAIPAVQEVVRQNGGYVASQPAAEGIAEAWHFFHSQP